ncbi:MAG: isochorismatase family protein [Spirochaetes bacterium]|nr:isochorismatase family protein [Spirochaetota bacterium]
MARIGTIGKAALLVVDVQNAVMKNAYDSAGVAARIAELAGRARAAGVPVIYVQHTDDSELPENSHGWQLVPELEAGPADHHIQKHFNSAFEETGLDTLLHEMQVSELILAGAATNWCIRATAYGP